jgi:sugar lactone lactonase YvrE
LALLVVALVVASTALADAEGTESPTPEVLSPQLIKEAINSPTVDLAAPVTDPQAAQQLPHDELDRSEALDLLTSVFGAQVESPAGLLDEMPPARYLTDHAAVMPADAVAAAFTRGEEEPAQTTEGPVLVESSIPLRTEDEEGQEAPVDLSLEHTEGEMQPTNPLVETGIPTQLGEGISLANGDVELSFPEAAAERSPSTVEENAAFYPNVQEDSDLLVAPVPGGVETMTQMRTPQSPRTQVVQVSLPEGAVLKETKLGGAEASLNGHTLMNVAAPSAVDAAENPVPMTLAVEGDTVEITISPSVDNSFPILGDPAWTIENYNWTWGGSSFASWTPTSFAPGYQPLTYQWGTGIPGLDLTSGFAGGATPNTGAQWQFWVPRYQADMAKYGVPPESYIEAVFTEGMMFQLEGNKAVWPGIVAGIIDPAVGWVSNLTWTGANGEIGGWGGHANFFNYEETGAKVFVYGLITLENEAQAKYRQAIAAKATTEVTDHNSPQVNSVSGPSGWWNTGEAPVGYAVSDAGLGVSSIQVVPPGGHLNLTGPEGTPEYRVGCSGTAASPCPRSYQSTESGSAKIAINTAGAPEGLDTYRFAVLDPLWSFGYSEGPVPHIKEENVYVKVDHSAPTVALSGTLTEQASLGTAKPQYALKYTAADGTREPANIYTTFGAEGSGNGQFKHPADVALDPAEKIWVADQVNNRIEKLGSKGEFLAAYGSLGSSNGQLNAPSGIEADEKGNIWVADTGNNRIEKFGSKGEYVTKFGTAGTGNGQLSAPKGVAIASNGNIWVADTGNNRIEEFSSSGTFIGAFGTKGSGNLQFSEPSALDVGPAGNVWVADTGNNRIEELNEKGEFLAAYGSLGTGNGQFNHPAGVDVDAKGNVYVLDASNGRVEQLSERGEYLSQFGAKGTASGQFTFSGAAGLTTNVLGEIWVTDSGDNRVEEWNPPKGTRSGVRKVVVKMDGKVVQEPTVTCPQGGCPLVGEWALHSGEYSAGTHTVEVIATDGVELSKTEKRTITLNPPAPSLSLSGALTEQGSLGTTLPHYQLKLSASAEEGSGVSQPGQSTIATQITVDGKQVDSGEASCSTETCPITREWTLSSGEYAAGPHTVIAKATDRFGRSTTKELKVTLNPPAPSVTLSGTMTEQATLGTTRPRYVLQMSASAEEGSGAAGAATYASSFGSTGTGNGQFSHPAGIAVDSAGNVWVADSNNNRIEEFNEKGEFLKAVGSIGTGAGQFTHPKSIAIDPKGNFWVADSANNRLEEFNSKWEFLKAVGSTGAGNGQFSGPEGIAIDAKGNVWVADTYNHRVQELNEKGEFVKVVSGLGSIEPTGLAAGPSGNVWIADWAGNRVLEVSEGGTLLRSFGTQGTGNGQFKQPDVITVDPSGTVWVGDQNNSRVQGFNQSGEYLTQFGAAGSGAGQFSFSYPMGIATDAKGDLWVSDTNNNRVQRWRPAARSRVTTEITLDGKQVDSGEASCSTETCPITREWVLGASSELVGKHTIVAKATDGYGQWTSKSRTIEIQPDGTKPTVQLGGELANAPEGWVQQESYGFNATASDGAGYGVTSLVFRIDGATVASMTQPCPEGACEGSISKGIGMASYSGGAHEAEVVATDGAGNSTTKHWTINVDPEGHVSTAEATATMEAVEETSASNLVGEPEEEDLSGTMAGLGLESTETGFVATGSAAPMTVATDPSKPVVVEVPEGVELFGCENVGGGLPEVPVGPDEGEEAGEAVEGGESEESEAECITQPEASLGELHEVAITPLEVSENAASSHLVGGNTSVAANTGGGTDSAIRPLSDGGMIFEAIRDASASETYSFKIDLGEEQVLRSVDETHAEVYYSGHLPAFSITAQPAHDAIGTAVPTTLTVDGRDIVTLHVNFQAGNQGQPFVYPIVGGTGWEGGFRTIHVEMGNHPPEEEYWESSVLIVGPPEPVANEGGGASASSTGEASRQFLKVMCGHSSFYGRPSTTGEGYVEECGNPFKHEPGYATPWQAGYRGAYFYKPGAWAEERGAHDCAGYGYDTSLTWYFYVKPAYQCIYGPRTSDGNGGTKTSAGHYLRAQAHWEVGHTAKCSGEFGAHAERCPQPNPWEWEDKPLEIHLWPSGKVERTVP